MGGWLALLLARALRAAGRAARLHALILIAPAVDMTQELMQARFTRREIAAMERQGFVEQPTEYADAPYRITRALIEDGARHLLFGRSIETGCPVTILQGGRDRDVPKEHALKLVQHLLADPVTFTLVPDGDHRLSRPQDLALLRAAIATAITE
jgi:pimeloyl-ACP methyl ester carboxylesterase